MHSTHYLRLFYTSSVSPSPPRNNDASRDRRRCLSELWLKPSNTRVREDFFFSFLNTKFDFFFFKFTRMNRVGIDKFLFFAEISVELNERCSIIMIITIIFVWNGIIIISVNDSHRGCQRPQRLFRYVIVQRETSSSSSSSSLQKTYNDRFLLLLFNGILLLHVLYMPRTTEW